MIQEAITYLVGKFPIAMGGYLVLTSAYTAFCFIATLTKTDKDDKLAAKLRMFFSLPPKK